MTLESLAFSLQPWSSALIALVPPMVVLLLVMMRASSRAEHPWLPSTDPKTLTNLVRIIFVLLIAFSVNSMWNQVSTNHGNATALALSADRVVRLVDQELPAETASSDASLRALMESFPPIINERTLPEVAESATAVFEFRSWVRSLPLPAEDRELMKGYLDDLEERWYDWVVSLNSPGVTPVILILILILGMLYVGVVAGTAVDPNVGLRYYTWVLFLNCVVTGLLQVPLWVIFSRRYTFTLDANIFAEFTGDTPSSMPLIIGYVVGLVAIGIFYLLLKPLARRRWSSAMAGPTA